MTNPATDGRFALLAWDSSLFGFPVASISPHAVADGSLPAVIERLRSAGVQLAYAVVPWSRTDATQALTQAGGSCVDRKVRFRKDAIACTEIPSRVESAMHTECSPDLERLALESAAYSRFRLDPRVPVATFVSLYREWIHRSLAGVIASEVLVIRDGAERVGMVTLARSDGGPTGMIGLLAVDRRHRGRGHGKCLVDAAESWCAARGWQAMEVVTQMRNVAACGFYAACGYRVVRDEAVFHVWLEPTR